ncbi:hypothetical protein FB451DRAFT_1555988 [Mycena latifolia]|nr:hypothetical protein FB451DRAFT_1555988 [Mycena latifolia]
MKLFRALPFLFAATLPPTPFSPALSGLKPLSWAASSVSSITATAWDSVQDLYKYPTSLLHEWLLSLLSPADIHLSIRLSVATTVADPELAGRQDPDAPHIDPMDFQERCSAASLGSAPFPLPQAGLPTSTELNTPAVDTSLAFVASPFQPTPAPECTGLEEITAIFKALSLLVVDLSARLEDIQSMKNDADKRLDERLNAVVLVTFASFSTLVLLLLLLAGLFATWIVPQSFRSPSTAEAAAGNAIILDVPAVPLDPPALPPILDQPVAPLANAPATPGQEHEELLDYIVWTVASRLPPTSTTPSSPANGTPPSPVFFAATSRADSTPSPSPHGSRPFILLSPRISGRIPAEPATPTRLSTGPTLEALVLRQLDEMEAAHATGEAEPRISVLEAARRIEEGGKNKGKGPQTGPTVVLDAAGFGVVKAIVQHWTRSPPQVVPTAAWKKLRPEEELVSGPSGSDAIY